MGGFDIAVSFDAVDGDRAERASYFKRKCFGRCDVVAHRVGDIARAEEGLRTLRVAGAHGKERGGGFNQNGDVIGEGLGFAWAGSGDADIGMNDYVGRSVGANFDIAETVFEQQALAGLHGNGLIKGARVFVPRKRA